MPCEFLKELEKKKKKKKPTSLNPHDEFLLTLMRLRLGLLNEDIADRLIYCHQNPHVFLQGLVFYCFCVRRKI